MMGYHRGDELPIIDECLVSCAGKGGDEEDDEACIEKQIQLSVRIHAAHGGATMVSAMYNMLRLFRKSTLPSIMENITKYMITRLRVMLRANAV